jgi:hypothetical protein
VDTGFPEKLVPLKAGIVRKQKDLKQDHALTLQIRKAIGSRRRLATRANSRAAK